MEGPEFDAYQVDFDEAMRRQSMYRTQETEADHKCKVDWKWIKKQEYPSGTGSQSKDREFQEVSYGYNAGKRYWKLPVAYSAKIPSVWPVVR